MNAIVDHRSRINGVYRPLALMRDPAVLMQPARLAAMQPSRLSAARSFIAEASRQRWSIQKLHFDIDAASRGKALYRIDTGSHAFSFVVHSFTPSRSGRTGRIIGTAWDMMGSLIDGEVSQRDVDLVGQEMPQLYHGRAAPNTLIWGRSNRSGRVFDEIVAALAGGRQPDVTLLAKANYAMRNTGLDGNGTFGTRSFLAMDQDHPLRPSLRAQMLTAYLMRVFALDLANHLARLEGGAGAAELDERLSRFSGVGNGSALGLMFYVSNHPRLIDRWLRGHEEALMEAKLVQPSAGDGKVDLLLKLLDRTITYRSQDRTPYTVFTSSAVIAGDLRAIRKELVALGQAINAGEAAELPFAAFAESIEGRYCADAVETINALLIELVPEKADAISAGLALDEELVGRPDMAVAHLRDIIRSDYGWVFGLDLTSEKSQRFVWYKSANAEEPRRGARNEVPANAYNLGFDLPRLVVALDAALAECDPKLSLARFLLTRPHLRRIVTRVQALQGLPYHTPHADIMSEDFVPAYITRVLNGAIHGLDRTEDSLNRVLRGVIMQGAPLAHDLSSGTAEPYWFHPEEPSL